MSEAVAVDLDIDAGADFGIQIYWTDAANNPIFVTAPMRMDLKAVTGQVVHSLITSAPEEEASNILYNSASGVIQLTIDAVHTSEFPPGIYSYDLFVTYQDNTVTGSTRLHKLLKGSAHVHGRVTQSI